MRSISLFFKHFTTSFLPAILLIVFLTGDAKAQSVTEGQALFKQKCTSCHALDRVIVGPALSGVGERHDAEWLTKWIRNSQSMIAAGDPVAVKLYNDYNKQVMTAFPELSDADITNILAYIANPPAPAAKEDGVATTGEADNGVSGFMLYSLLAVVILVFLVILVLNRVTGGLEKIVLQKQGVVISEEEEESSLARLKRLTKNKKFVFFVVLCLVIFLGSWGWLAMWNTGVHQGYQPEQPIKYSHQLHAGINKIDCQYCHSGAYKSKNASIPSANVCMNCHNYVTASDKYNGQVSPEIQKIYKALDYNPETKTYGKNQMPIKWIRIHNLPDFAYFNHSQHVRVAGIECQRCHGPIQTMEEVYQYSPLTMKWCVECHQETDVNSKGNAYYDKIIAAHDKLKKGERVTAAVLGGLECAKCHY